MDCLKFEQKELKAFLNIANSPQGEVIKEGLERQLRDNDIAMRSAAVGEIPELQAKARVLEAMLKRLTPDYLREHINS